jgi:hypothetical protein
MTTVTKELIESKIKAIYYFNVADAVKSAFVDPSSVSPEDIANLGLVTQCVIILENGFKVIGESACVDPVNYNEELGKKYAYEKAFDKVWEVEGYLLRQALHEKDETAKALASFAENNNCESGACSI